MATGKPRLTEDMLSFWKYIVFLLTPVILCPLPLYYASTEYSKIAACAYAVIIMAVYWTTEVLPLAVTALLPMVLFPIMGIQPSRHVCINYLNDSNFLFLGGLLVAVAMQRWNLHKRIALRTILTVGVEPRWLMLGMMSVTAFLSMWISNTATAAMMVPIAQAITTEILKDKGSEEQDGDQKQKNTLPLDENTVLLSTRKSRNEQSQELPLENIAMERCDQGDDDADLLADQLRPSVEQIDRKAKGLLLCICYAANIGGIATVIGTPPNIIVVQTVKTLFPKSPGIDFATWFSFGFPTMVLTLLLAWLWLQWQFLDQSCVPSCISQRGCRGRCQRNKNTAAHEVVRRQYDELGPFSFAESVVLSHFVLLVLLWFFRDMKFVKLENDQAAGWAYFFVRGFVTDSSAVMLISLSLFLWPSRLPSFLCCRGREDLHESEPAPSILDWSTVEENLPWEVIILLGGGFALADGVKVSGLSAWLGQGFRGLEGFSPVFIVIIITVMIAFTTEFSSNASTASIFLPILGTLAQGICVHPYYLMVPATIACSFAFMLPVATPPNAIVYSYGSIKVLDMAKSGFVLNLACLLVLNVAINTYGVPLYQLQQFPPWGKCTAPVTTVSPANVTTLLNN